MKLACLALLALGCAAENIGDDAAAGYAGAPAEQPATDDCQLVNSAAAPDFCRQDWGCPHQGLRSVICQQTPDAVTCICTDQESVQKQFAPESIECSDPGGNLTYLATCGWSASR